MIEDEADDLAEGEGHDGEIVAAQPQHREAENDAPHRGQRARERQANPERQAEGGRQQRIGIGADRVKGGIAEVEEAREADHDVEAPAQHHVDHDLDAVIVDPLQRAGGAEHAEHDQGKQRDEAEHERPEITREPGPRRRGRRDAFALARRLDQRAAHAAGGDRADAVEPDAPVGVRHLAQEYENEDDRGKTERERPAADQHELVVDVGFRVIAEDREAQAEGDERGGECVSQRGNELGGARRVGFGERGGLRGRGHRLRPSPLRAGRGCRRA